MAKLTFFRQGRFDGGVRTGINIGEETICHDFKPGTGDNDPALEWYVDVRCDGRGVPSDPVKAIAWLRDQSEAIRGALLALADKLAVGLDEDVWPAQFPIDDMPRGVTAKVVCSATRRTAARKIAATVKQLGSKWHEHLDAMSALLPVGRP